MINITHTASLVLVINWITRICNKINRYWFWFFPLRGTHPPLFSKELWLKKIIAKENDLFSSNPSNKSDNIRHFLKV